jgi:hypothetical protein
VTRKPSFEQYLLKATSALGFVDDPTNAERTYEFNLRAARQSVSSCEVMSDILNALKEMTLQYAGGNPQLLFYPADKIDDLSILQKPFKSTIDKIYRRNVLYNRSYPDAPPDGLIDVAQLYENIDDLLRTRLVCKYMDGPKYVCERLTAHCEAHGVASHFRELSTDAGYYAWHFYFRAPAEIMINNIVEPKSIWVEIQLTTQLAEVIDSLTHGLYEARRAGRLDAERKDWKWDASSQRFRSAYIGHGLHLLEGIIQSYKEDVLDAISPDKGGGANVPADQQATPLGAPQKPNDDGRDEEK